jgi:hypothetical protein
MVLKITDRDRIIEAKRREVERARQLEELAQRWHQARGPLETLTPDSFVEKAETARSMMTTGDAASTAAQRITDEVLGDLDELLRSQKTPDLETVMKLLQ